MEILKKKCGWGSELDEMACIRLKLEHEVEMEKLVK